MALVIPNFEMKEVEIRETFLDEQGKQHERIKKVLVPTGRVIEPDQDLSKLNEKGEERQTDESNNQN